MKRNSVIAILIVMVLLMGALCSCNEVQPPVGSQDIQTTSNEKGSTNTVKQDEPEKDEPVEADELNGEYGLSHIVVTNISNGQVRTYREGDSYYGMLLSFQTISVTLNNGTGTMSYSFERTVTTNITYEKIDNKFIMICEDAVDLFNNGNPQTRFELLIEELDGKVCFVLTASGVYDVFSYYVVAK